MNKKAGIIVLTLLAWVGIAAFLLTRETAAPSVSFTSLAGEKIAMQDLRGKVVLVNFWATTCAPCAREMPRLSETYRKYRARGLETIAVAMSYDPPMYVERFARHNELPFKVALDGRGEIAKAFEGVDVTPTTYIINKQGKIIRHIAGELDFPTLEALLEKELAV